MRLITILLFLFMLSVVQLHAQSDKVLGTATKHIVKPKGALSETRLILSGFTNNIIIEGSNRKDIEISTDNYERKPERADGLRSLSEMAVENTQIGLGYEFKGSEILLTPASRRAQNADYSFKVPSSIKIKVDGNIFHTSDILVKGMSNEVELMSQNGDIQIESVTGPIVAKTISGDIEITFRSLNQELPTSINSVNGDIDITLSATDKGSFSISSLSGEVYTDLDLKVEKTGRSVSDHDWDVEVHNQALTRAMVEVERAHIETQKAMKETERAMKEMEKDLERQIKNENKKATTIVAPVPPVPPQIAFHHNWATPSGIGSKFKALLNGGGVEFNISSISGDVYLRKEK